LSLSSSTIDRIVSNVLHQLGGGRSAVEPVLTAPNSSSENHIDDKVITADSIAGFPVGSRVVVSPNAIVTPAANDTIRELKLVIVEGVKETCSGSSTSKSAASRVAIVVHHTDAVERIVNEFALQKELLGCPDDAATFAIGEICRGGVEAALIFAEQTHRAACFANRNNKVKAVIVSDGGDVKAVRKQLRANTWCVDPTGKTYFEMRNLVKSIVESGS